MKCDEASVFGAVLGGLLSSCILRQSVLLVLLARVEIAHFRTTREGRSLLLKALTL